MSFASRCISVILLARLWIFYDSILPGIADKPEYDTLLSLDPVSFGLGFTFQIGSEDVPTQDIGYALHLGFHVIRMPGYGCAA